MHSKFLIWDFFAKLKQNQYEVSDLHVFLCKDLIFCELVKKYLRKNGQYKTVFGPDVTLEWLENNVFGLSLFGNENYIVVDAHKLPS